MSHEVFSQIDIEARRKGMKLLKEKFEEVVRQIINNEPPTLIIPRRTLTNTIYDPEKKVLLLGPESMKRSFIDLNEAKKFMQTTLMASIIHEALANNEYPTIRDLYYRGKHSIVLHDKELKEVESTWDDQRESDGIIRDLEVYLGLLREELLILSKEKGKVVGNMRIRSGNDIIDLSKMGHGAYSIEPTPDFIEFIDVDAEYVLVVEKDAVFQQLHRYGFWKRNKAILVTSAGQPDRATRRFVRRLNEELKLPVYVLCDSVPRDEVVALRNPETGEVSVGPIEELVKEYFNGYSIERALVNLEVLSWNPASNSIEWSPIAYVYRHRIFDKMLVLKTDSRGVIRVTKAHSIFALRNGVIQPIPAKDLQPGDYILVAKRLPPIQGHALNNDVVSEDCAWLIGLLTLRGSFNSGYLYINLNGLSTSLIERVVGTLRKLGLDKLVELSNQSIKLAFNEINQGLAKVIREAVEERIVTKTIISSPNSVKLAYISGLIEASKGVNSDGTIVSLHDGVLAKQLALMLLSIGAELVVNNDGNTVKIKTALSSGSYSVLLQDSSSSGIDLAKVIEVGEEDYMGYVYDFAVPGTNSFVGGYGVIYHNSDPYGFYIYSVFKVGSITLSYESERLSTPSAKFIGVMPTDVFGDSIVRGIGDLKSLGETLYDSMAKLPEKKPYLTPDERRNYVIRAKVRDVERAVELVGYDIALICLDDREVKSKIKRKERVNGYPWFRTPEWLREACTFFKTLAKLEIEAMASKGLKFLADIYIPEKIQINDWIE